MDDREAFRDALMRAVYCAAGVGLAFGIGIALAIVLVCGLSGDFR